MVTGVPAAWNSRAVAPKSMSGPEGAGETGEFDAATAKAGDNFTTCSLNPKFSGLANAFPVSAYSTDPSGGIDTPPAPQIPPPSGPFGPLGYQRPTTAGGAVVRTCTTCPWYGRSSQGSPAVAMYS